MSGLLPCDPTWEGTGGARGVFGFYRLAISFSTRVIVWGSVYTSIRLARRTNCCSLSAENSTATNLTHRESLSDLSRSTAFHYCAVRSCNHYHVCRGTNYSVAQWARCQCMPYTAEFSDVQVTVLQLCRALCFCPSTT